MRGISFRVCNSDKHILLTILKGIDVEKLWWNISEEEIYNEMDESIFLNKNINGGTFLKIL